MRQRHGYTVLPLLVWALALIAIPCWIAVDQPIAWDFGVIKQAMQSLRSGHDPYLDGIASQDAYVHSSAALRGEQPPFVYVYSPITVELLRPLSRLPVQLVEVGYWALYIFLIAAQLAVAKWLVLPTEKFAANLLVPLPLFFPGLLLFDSVLGGNVAFILFGLIFIACWYGWRREQWLPFYAAVLLASCFKVPYLTLLAIPLLSARGQWIRAGAAAAIGFALFVVQERLWPLSFHNYLLAVNRIFSFNHDFGSGPAGRLAASLAALHLPYALASALFYVAISLLLFFCLLQMSRAYFDGRLRRERWLPLMMLGVLLLNPRLIEYEIFPFTFFMAIIAFRLIASTGKPRWTAAVLFAVWLGANVFSCRSRAGWKCCECAVLLTLFIAGYMQLRAFWSRQHMASAPVA